MAEAIATRESKSRGQRRSRVGVVVADARQKTAKIRLDLLVKHPKYGKYLKTQKVIHVHDEDNTCKSGDVVEVLECRPMSKTKSWRFARKVREAAAKQQA